MTTIQTHEAELRAMMERAGLAVNESRSFQIVAAGSGRMVALHMLGHYHECRMTDSEFPAREFIAGASHTDPRIALRACLEMAGLLTDRPPQTDEQLAQWLTGRWGEPVRMGGVTSWGRARIRLFHANSGGGWVQGNGADLTARELGAILWCAERFPEVTE
jgi:hypothetical protein